MDRRRAIAATVSALGLGVLGYALFSPLSEEEQVENVLRALCAAVSFDEPIQNPMFFGSHLSEQFQDLLTEDVRVMLSEVHFPIPSHRGQLGLAAARGLSRYGSLNATLGGLEIQLQEGQAEARATVTVVSNSGGEVRRADRPVDFSLIKVDGEFRVASVKVRPELSP